MNEKLLTHARGRLSRLLLLFALLLTGAQVSWADDVTFTTLSRGTTKTISEAGTYYYSYNNSRSTTNHALIYSNTDVLELYSDKEMTTPVTYSELKNVGVGSLTNKKTMACFEIAKSSTYYIKLTTTGESSIKGQYSGDSYVYVDSEDPYTFVDFPVQIIWVYTPESDGTIVTTQTFPEGTDCSSLSKSWWTSVKEGSSSSAGLTVSPEYSDNVVTYRIPATAGKNYYFFGTWIATSTWTDDLLPMTVKFSLEKTVSFTELTLDESVAIDAAGEYYYSYAPAADSTYAIVCNSADAVKLYSDAALTTEVQYKEEDNGDGTKSIVFSGTAGTTYYIDMTAAAVSSIKVTMYDNTITIIPIELDTDVATNAGKNYYSVDVSSVITGNFHGQVVVAIDGDATVVPYSDAAFTSAIDYDTFTGTDGKKYIRFSASSATYYLLVTGSATINVTAALYKNTPSVVIPIELNTLYTQPGQTKTSYSFTTTKAEKCYINYSGFNAPSVDGVTLSMTGATGFITPDADGLNCQRYFTAEAGKTYTLTLYNNNSADYEGKFKVFMDSDNKLDTVSVSPAVGEVFSITGGSVPGRLSVAFSKGVSITGATLTCGTASVSLDRTETSFTSSVLLDGVGTAIQSLLSAGTAKAGDAFTVTISGIAAADNAEDIFGTDGTLVLNYIMPEMAMELVSSSMPEKFLSKWESGDETGVASMTFNKNISTTATPTATISCGSKDKDSDGGYYQETVPVTVNADGMSLTIDFTGKSRTYTDMFPNYDVETALADESLASSFQNVSLKVGNIMDTDSTYCYTGSTAHTGSFSFSIPYEQLTVSTDITVEFDPASGSFITSTDSIEIYAIGLDNVTYSGATFTYDVDGTETVTTVADAEIVKSEADENGGVSLKFAVPAAAKTARDVKVTLGNLQSTSGADVSSLFTATYNPSMVLTLIKPTATVIDTLKAGQDSIIAKTNIDSEIGAMYFQLYDLNPTDPNDACMDTGYMTPATDSETGEMRWVREIYADLVLLENHEYGLYFTAAASEADYRNEKYLGTDTIKVSGSSKAYEYSTYTLESLSPDPDTYTITSVADSVFTVTFSGPVTTNKNMSYVIDGSGTTSNFESITPVDESGNAVSGSYSKIWKLKASESVMESIKGNLPIAIAAEDEQGRRVKGTEGKEAQSYFYFNYTATLGVPEVTVTPADGSTVTEINVFTAECSSGIACSGWIGDSKVILYDANNNEVAHVTSAEQVIPDEELDNWDYVPTQMTLTLNDTITASGTYKFVIPASYFVLGTDMDNYNSNETVVNLTIAEVVEEVVTSTPADSSTVTSLKYITLKWVNESEVNDNGNSTDAIVLYDANGTAVAKATGSGISTGAAAWNEMDITLDTEVTAEGTYTLKVPAGRFLLGSDGNRESQAHQFTYTIVAPAADVVTSDPADGSTVSKIETIILTWSEETMVYSNWNKPNVVVLQDANGTTVATPSMSTGENPNQIYVIFEDAITTAGTYTLVMPEGAFLLGSMLDKESVAHSFTYIVDGTLGINGISPDANGRYNVYTVSGIRVKSTNSGAELKNLKPGMYIINGKKVALK